MRISDWSSYVCSSDLSARGRSSTSFVPQAGPGPRGRMPLWAGPYMGENSLRSAECHSDPGLNAKPTPGNERPMYPFPKRATPTDAVQQWENLLGRSEEHTSELQSLMRISYADVCCKKHI